MNDTKYDFSETLQDLDAGVFLEQLSNALQEVALGVVEYDKKGKVTLTFELKRIGDSHQVKFDHAMTFIRPTKRGDRRETVKTSTPLHVGRGGRLSIMPDSQGDLFREKPNHMT